MRLLRVRGSTALLLLALLASACSVGGGQQGAPLAGCNSGTTQATFWTSRAAHDSDVLKSIVTAFNKQSNSTCVKLTTVPGSETDIAKLQTAVRGGTAPDVYELDRFTVAERAAAGVLEDLSPLGADSVKGNYLDFAWGETQYKGHTYALPFDTDTRALYYNKDLLAKAGITDLSALDPKNGPPTIAQIRDMANKINHKDGSGNYDVIGFVPYLNQGWHYTWGFVYGGSFFDKSSCKVTPDDPKIVRAFKDMFYDWDKALGADKVATFVSSYQPPNQPPAQDPFLTGHLGFVVTGDWVLGNIQTYNASLKYGVTYIPVPNKGDQPATWAGGWSNVIPKGAKNPKGGLELMKYMTGEPGQRVWTTETQHTPTIKALTSDASLFPGDHKFFVDQLPAAHSRPPLPVGGFYWDQLSTAQNEATLAKGDPAQSLKAAADATNAKLQQYCPLA